MNFLLAIGNVGGIMRNNGRYTASEEVIDLVGNGDLIEITENVQCIVILIFQVINMLTLYDVNIIEGGVRDHVYFTLACIWSKIEY